MIGRRWWGAAAALALMPATADSDELLDAFEDVAAWQALPADGVGLDLRADDGFRGRSLRMDFRFTGGGYAVARRDMPIRFPDNYELRFRVRGTGPPNHLEVKLVDSTGDNVWWHVFRNYSPSGDWSTLRIRKRQLSFAWGPLGGGELREAAAIEFAVTAGTGGTGSLWIDELELVSLAPADLPYPAPRLTSSSGKAAPDALDEDPTTFWSPDANDPDPWIAIDFGRPREFGGLTIHWADASHAGDYVVETSDDAVTWTPVFTVTEGNGGKDPLFLPESEARHLRVRSHAAGLRIAIAELEIQPLAWSASREAFFAAIAGDSPRGTFPRGIAGEQSYWTVVGVDADPKECLLSEDGAVEAGLGEFSIEPFLFVDGHLRTWADATIDASLEAGFLPMPSATWSVDDLTLRMAAFATGEPGASSVVVRYVVSNAADAPRDARLYLAARPFQVNPPSQQLNHAGGTAPVREIRGSGRFLHVNGDLRVVSVADPAGFGASPFPAGDIVEFLRKGVLPGREDVTDPFAAASGAWEFPLALAGGDSAEVAIVLPLDADSPVPRGEETERRDWVDRERDRTRSEWLHRLQRVTIEVPAAGQSMVRSLGSQLAYILVNRAGPAIQPGARSYRRSWIRDGALTSWALLRLGQDDVVREFLEWYSAYQYADGKVPCVVDERGADPVPEHDSAGEFLFLVAQYWRYTRDRDLVERLWPQVELAADYLDALRQERRTEEYRHADRREFYGLLPPSISHEGYSAKPMHSYWDDFFALRGFKDATFLAGQLGHEAARARFAAMRTEFESDLVASIEAAAARHGIDYIPGCADLGDFDPTSTTIALAPAGAESVLPADLLTTTFERYWTFFVDRRDRNDWEAYTPYEIRNVGAFVRLGWRERAHELLTFFLDDQRPAGWNQWPEVVRRDQRQAAFLGDLPHGWVASDAIRSVLDLFAYRRESEESLVIGAGVPVEWLAGSGVRVRGLRTEWGQLDLTMTSDGEVTRVLLGGNVVVPPGGFAVHAPEPYRRASVNGVEAATTPGTPLRAWEVPARLEFSR
ncbi:discoidin domain-containing protein [bacterium]|nr:discoidin domain-containing protein [bacterium]